MPGILSLQNFNSLKPYLPFERLDIVVIGALHRIGRYWMVVPSQVLFRCVAMVWPIFIKGPTSEARVVYPLVKVCGGCGLVRRLPNQPQFILETIGFGQRLMGIQRFLQRSCSCSLEFKFVGFIRGIQRPPTSLPIVSCNSR